MNPTTQTQADGLLDARQPAMLRDAVEQLSRSEKGRDAAAGLLDWINQVGLGLDEKNQQAILHLLAGTFGPHTGTVRDLLAEMLIVVQQPTRRASSGITFDDCLGALCLRRPSAAEAQIGGGR